MESIGITPAVNESVAVIIPTRGRNALLERAVRSVLNNSCQPEQIIVVDDNGPDRCLRKTLPPDSALFDPKIDIVENSTPKNAARARNVGLAHASTGWVTYLDDDDEYALTKIEKQLRLCLETNAAFALCGYEVILPLRRRRRQTDRNVLRGTEIYTDARLNTPFFFHKRDSALQFDESLSAHEDADFFFRAIKYFHMEAVPVAPEPLVIVRPQEGARVNTNVPASLRAQKKIYRRHLQLQPREVRHKLLAEMMLSQWKQGASGRSLPKVFAALLPRHGLAAFRLTLNALLFRLPWTRRFVVS